MTASDIILENLVDHHLINGVVSLLADLCRRKAAKAYAEGDDGLGDAWIEDGRTLDNAAEDVGEPA